VHVSFGYREGLTRVGREHVDPKQDIVLFGLGIENEHAIVEHTVEMDPSNTHLVEVNTVWTYKFAIGLVL
jgi:hypothetical protein